jgi:hypothetical protein
MVVQPLLELTAIAGVDTGDDSSLLLLAEIRLVKKTSDLKKRLQTLINDHPAEGPLESRRSRGSGVTLRSLLTGTILAICISTGAPYGNMVLRGSYMALDFSTAGAIFLFFILVLLVHTGLGLIHPRLAFRPEEPSIRAG